MVGDLNVNISLTQTKRNNNANVLVGFTELFALSDSVNITTFTKSVCCTPIAIMFTNKPKSFSNTSAVTTYLNDCHKLILSCTVLFKDSF